MRQRSWWNIEIVYCLGWVELEEGEREGEEEEPLDERLEEGDCPEEEGVDDRDVRELLLLDDGREDVGGGVTVAEGEVAEGEVVSAEDDAPEGVGVGVCEDEDDVDERDVATGRKRLQVCRRQGKARLREAQVRGCEQ